MFATPAFAQAAGAAAPSGTDGLLSMLPMLIGFIAIMYFFMIRPQQQRAKQHKAMISAIKRNDTVVLSSGLIGKVTRVEDAEISMEVASGVNVRVVKAMITEVRAKGEPAPANDTKAA
ncbi:preprotein translocase, YajC subunit [Asticcacaulis biprosthecium C19]|uniref:Sec translocon accessory complex subunit YajC n=1 Tax=Asticcacaulis biprosthecium C19 TaxID=715226 RepID=F4QQ32_9CAUL|nr:preprotein translocase subunit YajC [Asticcacaulis biprosthecium]EGF90319.1 preprotein translocase, YajC subunit [Asticcacaulis biprosthecium C19]